MKVETGEVTLSGSVAERGEKRRAECLIEHIPGVRDVHNHVRVNHNGRDEGLGRTTVLGLNKEPNAGGAGWSDRPANTTAGTTGMATGEGSGVSSAALRTGDSNPGITGGRR